MPDPERSRERQGLPVEERLTAVEIIAARNRTDIAEARQQQLQDMAALRGDLQNIHDRISNGNQRSDQQIRHLEVVVAGEAARTMRMLWVAAGSVVTVVSALIVLFRVFGV